MSELKIVLSSGLIGITLMAAQTIDKAKFVCVKSHSFGTAFYVPLNIRDTTGWTGPSKPGVAKPQIAPDYHGSNAPGALQLVYIYDKSVEADYNDLTLPIVRIYTAPTNNLTSCLDAS